MKSLATLMIVLGLSVNSFAQDTSKVESKKHSTKEVKLETDKKISKTKSTNQKEDPKKRIGITEEGVSQDRRKKTKASKPE